MFLHKQFECAYLCRNIQFSLCLIVLVPVEKQTGTCFPTDTCTTCTRLHVNLSKKPNDPHTNLVLFCQKTISLGSERVCDSIFINHELSSSESPRIGPTPLHCTILLLAIRKERVEVHLISRDITLCFL